MGRKRTSRDDPTLVLPPRPSTSVPVSARSSEHNNIHERRPSSTRSTVHNSRACSSTNADHRIGEQDYTRVDEALKVDEAAEGSEDLEPEEGPVYDFDSEHHGDGSSSEGDEVEGKSTVETKRRFFQLIGEHWQVS